MGKLSPMNPLGHIINRQLNGDAVIRKKLFQERLAGAQNLFRKDLLAHYGCVNAVQFSSEGELLISGGDDRRVLLWSVPEVLHGGCNPIAMATNHISNIFCLEFDSVNSKIFSGGNDDQVIVHDLKTGSFLTKLAHKKPVYGLSVNPQSDFIIATACDDGRILMYDIRSSTTDPICLAKEKTAFHSVMFNPLNSRLLATANSEEGICLWDCRKPKETLIHYDSCTGSTSGISVCFNGSGSRLLALRRRLPPVLYATQSQSAICQFYHPQYYNSCTMKTCCFAGNNDEYVLSGSDDFNLYMWRIPRQDCEWGVTHMVLQSHRSIVNQVCYNKRNNLIASSGVEKMVKLWSSLPIGTWEGSLSKESNGVSRSVYSHDDYIYLVGNSGQRISHDYSDQSIQEDCRMMAFFDSLIQKEIEGWDSPSEVTISTDSDSDTSTTIQSELQGSTYLPRTTLHYSRRLLEETKKQKPNRIAQLIAQKRNRLAKMAKCKSPSSLYRYSKRNHAKNGKSKSSKNAKSKKSALRHTYHSTVETSSSTSHSEKENRKHKLHQDKSDRYTRSKKFRSRQNFKDICENSISNSSIDGPSTSTGITGSGTSVFRVYEQDSDDDIVPPNGCTESRRNSEENNFVNILPTPLNGTHDLCINALDMSSRSSSNNDRYTNGNEASTSNALKRRSCDSLFTYDSDSSDYDYNYTPAKRFNGRDMSTPDSGIATAACSSGSSYTKHHLPYSSRYNRDSSDDQDYPYETFRKRTKKARLNIRKQIIGDSDSN